MEVLKHLHLLHRWKNQFGEMQYRCIHPDCTFFAARSFLLGKRVCCALCGKGELILNVYDLRLAIPRCKECSETKEAKAKKRLAMLMGEVFEQVSQEETER